MIRINAGLYSSNAHDWKTPPDFIEKLLAFEGFEVFSADVACSESNVPALEHFTPKQDGLTLPWWLYRVGLHAFWMNPPYGNELKKWVNKAYIESLAGCRVWGLIPARPDTAYWHDCVLTPQSFVFFLKGRLSFISSDPEQKSGTAPFPTALVYWGHDWEEVAKRFIETRPFEGTLMVCGGKECR